MINKDKHGNDNIQNLLTSQESVIAKGYLAIIVFIHHVILYSKCLVGTVIYKIASLGGFLAVSMFFFLSGYGLSVSLKRDKAYINKIIRNRIPIIYSNYLVSVLCYFIMYLLAGRNVSLRLVFQSLLFGKTIVFGGWYIQTVLLFYACYYFAFKTIHDNRLVSLTLVLALNLAYMAVCYCLNMDSFWYISTVGFMGGILCTDITNFTKLQHKSIVIKRTAISISFILFFVFLFAYTHEEQFEIQLLFGMLACVFFIIIFLAMLKAMSKSKVLSKVGLWFGRYSFSIYLFQGIFILGLCEFTDNYLYLIWFYLICSLGTIIVSFVMTRLFNRINRIIRREI